MIPKCQLSVLLSEGKCATCTANLLPCEKQLLLSFSTNGKNSLTIMYFTHNCTKHRPRLLPSGSEAMPHENHLYYE